MLMYSSSLVFTKSNWSLICSDCNGDQSVASRRVLIRSMAVVSSFLSELVLFLGLQCLTFLPVKTKIGKWSEISATSIPDRKYSSLLPLT